MVIDTRQTIRPLDPSRVIITDKDGTERQYSIFWNWGGAGHHRVWVIITYPKGAISTYTYYRATGKAALAISYAKNPELGRKAGAQVFP